MPPPSQEDLAAALGSCSSSSLGPPSQHSFNNKQFPSESPQAFSTLRNFPGSAQYKMPLDHARAALAEMGADTEHTGLSHAPGQWGTRWHLSGAVSPPRALGAATDVAPGDIWDSPQPL